MHVSASQELSLGSVTAIETARIVPRVQKIAAAPLASGLVARCFAQTPQLLPIKGAPQVVQKFVGGGAEGGGEVWEGFELEGDGGDVA